MWVQPLDAGCGAALADHLGDAIVGHRASAVVAKPELRDVGALLAGSLAEVAVEGLG